ncbi:uncharacterized protein LOC114543862 [Dendronephthya gigantea]|uniref:uncharacterized protein LOC114543862 n=1 Tax=Dendronephthya gigantea TaxID=151771 RepID=UPI00106C7402|nr:uncharacterized protein LOC114543862 [Dendronephthya gigantea]
MPPVRRSKRVAAPSAVLRESVQNQPTTSRRTRSSPDAVSVGATPSTSTVPVSDVALPSLSSELISTLVSSVTEAVTQKLAGFLPTSASSTSTMASAPTESTSGIEISNQGPNADSLVNDALTSIQENLTGQTTPFSLPCSSAPGPRESFHSAALPLDSRIPDKIKFKIWNEEFVDISTLSGGPDAAAKYEISVRTSDNGQPASLFLEPAAKSKRVKTISDWLRSFHIFVSIYTQRYPHESPALMKYCQIIQDLANRGHNWFYYDENFRFLRQTQATRVPWATVHWELWLKSQYPTTSKPNTQGNNYTRHPSKVSVPRGYCFKFHRGTFCAGCDFKHICFKCNGSHRAVNCNFRANNRPSPTDRSPKPISTKSVANTRKTS